MSELYTWVFECCTLPTPRDYVPQRKDLQTFCSEHGGPFIKGIPYVPAHPDEAAEQQAWEEFTRDTDWSAISASNIPLAVRQAHTNGFLSGLVSARTKVEP